MEQSADMDKHSALRSIASEAAQGQLNFPTSAELALRVMRALDDPACRLDAVARLVQSEPMLSARVVAMANSVAYNRSGQTVSDVPQAVTRLGFGTVHSLAGAVVTRQMAGLQGDPHVRRLIGQLWQHSAHVAALAHLLARRVTHQDADSAMFAGIIHEVGGFYLISRSHDFPGLLDGDLSELRGESAHEVGRAVMRALEVPAAIVDAVELMWQGYLSLPPVSLGDTLLLADELSPHQSPWEPPLAPMHGEHSEHIELLLGPTTLSALLADSAAAVDSLSEALHF